MSLVITPSFVAILAVVVIGAGAVNGVAGFGFALVGTMALATVVDPVTAVVFMIVPIMAVNLSLVRDLSTEDLRECSRRFSPLMVSALIGTLAGIVLLEHLPAEPLRVGLGLVTVAFVAVEQQRFPLPGLKTTKERCFVESPTAMIGVGGISGLLFGGTNVGVQLVAYLRSCRLPHGLFVGVVAMVFLGLNGVRVVAAGVLGLYPTSAVFLASILATVPAAVGVTIGKRARSRVTESHRRIVVLGLLLVIGTRLIVGGLGFV